MSRRSRAIANLLALMVLIQAGLGIATLLAVVPVWLGALHQAGALTLFTRDDDWHVPVVLVSAPTGEGLDELHKALAAHRDHLGTSRLAARRKTQEKTWIDESVRARFGAEGVAVARKLDLAPAGPFGRERQIAARLQQAMLAAIRG